LNRKPLPNETLQAYIERVICGFPPPRPLAERRVALEFFEPSYVRSSVNWYIQSTESSR
jgi:hypothetical protein